jgi:RHS repeat-associated protein
MFPQLLTRNANAYLVRTALTLACLVFVFTVSDTTIKSQGTFNHVAVDDEWVFQGGPLYIAWNDTNPMPQATIVKNVDFGTLTNSGQFQTYGPGMSGVYVDSYSYKWCENISPFRCSNTATVTLLVNVDGSQDYGNYCAMPSPKPAPPPTAVAQPVNVTNGNMWLQQSDYSLPGLGEAIEINRFYNSKLEAGGLFGYGWTTKYDELLTLFPGQDRMLKLTMPDGRGVYFGRPDNTVNFRSISVDVRATIEQAPDNTFTLTFADGRTHKFDSTGKLLWQRDRAGNQTTLGYNLLGDLEVTDPGGRTLTLDLDANGKVLSITDATGKIADYFYDSTGVYLERVEYTDGSKYVFTYDTKVIGGQTRKFVATVKDALNNVIEAHAYDSQGRATTSERDGGIEKYTFTYSSTYTTVVDALGRSTKYYFTSNQKRKQITKIEGVCGCGSGGTETTNFEYDVTDLNLTRKVDALGRQTLYEYDNDKNLTKITDVLGIQKFTYNSAGQVLTYKDRVHQNTSSNTVVNAYSSLGELLTTADALGNTTTFTYSPLGQLATVTDARNNVTTLTYDSQGRLTQVTDANNKNTSYGYDARSRVTSTTNALNETTAFEYDLHNRPKKITHPDTNYREVTYDLAGRPTAVKDERGNTTNYGFDNAYRWTSVTDPLSHASSVGYDLMSNMTSRTDALGNTTNYEYDDFNRLKKIVYPPATTGGARLEESLTYDKVGSVKTRVDTAGRTTTYDYDGANRLLKITDPLLKLTQFEYNSRSQMTKVKDALNQEYVFTYDALGRELSQTRAGTTSSSQYDSVGNRTQRTDYLSRVTNYTYDPLNRLTNITYVPSGQGFATFSYDDLSRLTSAVNQEGTVAFTYDDRNRVKATTDVFGHTIEYSYDANSNRSQLKLDSNVHTAYNYDNANRLTTLTDEASQNFGYGYDAADRLTSKTLPNGITSTIDYDGMSRLKRLLHQSAASTLVDNNFTYNAASQISQIAELAQTRNLTYDNVNRLTGMTNGTANESYTFDGVGNRTASHLSVTYTYQPFNRMTATATATMSYNANGNLIGKSNATMSWSYSWDYENRMTQASNASDTVHYRYDALGRRVERYTDVSLEDKKFTYDGLDVVMDDDATTGITKYQNGPGIDDKLKLSNGGVSKYFLADHLGSTVALTDTAGAVTEQTSYDSFGNQTTNLSTRYQYTGREYDSFSGFYYYRARWYDSNLGRFISEDPIGFAGGGNWFAYVGNHPIRYRDALGLQRCNPVLGGIAGGIAGGALGALGGAVVGGALGAAGGCIAGAVGLGIAGSSVGPEGTLAGGGIGCAAGAAIGMGAGIGPGAFVGSAVGAGAGIAWGVSNCTDEADKACDKGRVIPFPRRTPQPTPRPTPTPTPPPPDRLTRCKLALADCMASAGGDLIMQGKCAAAYNACAKGLPTIFPHGVPVP